MTSGPASKLSDGRRAPWAGAPPEELAQRYYDATSWIYRWVWGASFHFAPLPRSETRRRAIRRYEQELANELGIRAEHLCLDLGCGIGGPAATIEAATGARIVGLNANQQQLRSLERRRRRCGAKVRGVGGAFEFLPFADGIFDRVYAFEALCHAVDLEHTFREIHRITRPGGRLAFSEWCLTDRFDAADAAHQRLRGTIESAYGVVTLRSWPQWNAALEAAGFRIVGRCDRAALSGGDADPWYRGLEPRDRTLDSLGRMRSVRALQESALALAARCGFLPRDTVATVRHLREGTAALIEAGSDGIFTPMMRVVAEKEA